MAVAIQVFIALALAMVAAYAVLAPTVALLAYVDGRSYKAAGMVRDPFPMQKIVFQVVCGVALLFAVIAGVLYAVNGFII